MTSLVQIKRYLSLIMILMIIDAHALSFRTYEADIEESKWSVISSPIRCELQHDVPLFGEATFFAKASRKPNMFFVLDSDRNRVITNTRVDIRSVAPAWKPGVRGADIDAVGVIPGEKLVNLNTEVAWKLLTTLEVGRHPTFYYRDLVDGSDRVSVSLSAVNFSNVYDDFLGCISQLLPYDFWEIQHTMVNFTFNGSQLTDSDKKKLDVLAEFLIYDKDISQVLVDGHTDSIGIRRYNKGLGTKRAKRVKSYLVEKGVDSSKIVARSYGERKPLESNATVEGQAINRRVFVTLKQTI